MIQISELRFCYGRGDFELRISELEIAQGERVACIGPSGSGKTTLLRLLSGVNVPAAGVVSVNGEAVSAMPDSKRRAFRSDTIGFVFQDFELIEYLNVLDNILYQYRISPALSISTAVRSKVVELATKMQIADKLKSYPGELSQGEKQRVAICRALSTDPALILADEPTGNLDPKNKQRIVDLLFQSAEERNATLIVVTHDHQLLPRFERVIDFSSFTLQQAA